MGCGGVYTYHVTPRVTIATPILPWTRGGGGGGGVENKSQSGPSRKVTIRRKDIGKGIGGKWGTW